MNITFLVGNGFDLNLGLKTSFSDFAKVYSTMDSKSVSENLQRFRKEIEQDQALWSFAEMALGQYTRAFEEGEGERFSECHTDYCEQLAVYLKGQETRFDYSRYADRICKAFTRLESIMTPYPIQERDSLKQVYANHSGEEIDYNFICFNYTETLDNCLLILDEKKKVLGTHQYNNRSLSHKIAQLCHVHGTVKGNMVFGVNDDSQIGNLGVFNCEYGDIYKRLLIKQMANESYAELTDFRAAQIINSSHIIYIYGMSLGITDTLWWERINAWLTSRNDRHLIIYKHNAPIKSVLPVKFQRFESEQKRAFLAFGKAPQEERRSIEARIHISTDNLFVDLKNLAE